MKVCKMGLNSAWVDHANGDVRICSWASYNAGNLIDNSIEEVWHGEKAEAFRRSMLDGSYSFCDKSKCPYCANETLEEILVDYEVPEYPTFLNLAYEENCNYCCVFCRKEKYVPGEGEQENIKKIEQEINKFIGKLEVVASNGVGELFCSPSAMNILGKIDNPDIEVVLETNGSLFNAANWERISNLSKNRLSLTVTVHSFIEDVYQELSGTNLPLKNLIDNLYFIKSLREKEIINFFEIGVVVCDKNFREMPEYITYALEQFNPDAIRVRFFEPYAVQDRATEWFLDVRNPYHPYYKEFVKVMEHPALSHPKVWKWQGNTLSCQKEHPYYAEHEKSIVLSNLLQIKDGEAAVRNWMETENIKTFALYGNSIEGRAFATYLGDRGICFDVFYDTYPQFNCDFGSIKFTKPTASNVTVDAVIITAMSWTSVITEHLQKLGYKGKIYSLNEFVNQIICGGALETGKR